MFLQIAMGCGFWALPTSKGPNARRAADTTEHAMDFAPKQSVAHCGGYAFAVIFLTASDSASPRLMPKRDVSGL
jgi:hypothetical protein